MVQVVCSDVEKHAVCMLTELHRMKQDNDHCDFIIQVGDDVYRTHKNILSAGSAYFKAMLKHDTKESREGKVVLKDMDSECVKSCIDYIYSGKFEIPDGKIIELLHVAIMMQLENLKQVVSNILVESITVENYISTRNVADIYGLVEVSSRCRIFFQENIMEISNQDGFEGIEKDDLLSLLKSEKLKLCEEDKLALILKWIDKCQSTSEDSHEFVEVIKFDQISLAYLQDILETHPRISNHLELYKLFTGHILKASIKTKKYNDGDELIILFDYRAQCLRSFDPISEEVNLFHEAKCPFQFYFTAMSHGSYIYVFCEAKSVYRLDYRRKLSTWEKMDDMICHHGKVPRSVCSTGSVFVIGGSNSKATTDVERFDPSVNTWFQLESKPSPISDASLVSFGDSIYCIGGLRDDVVVSSFCRFTPSSSEWADLEPVRYPMCRSGAVAVYQRIFVIGGWIGRGKINTVECYDVASAQWTSLSSMNSGHSDNYAYRLGNWIFVVDGFNETDTIEKYNLLSQRWYRLDTAGKFSSSFRITGGEGEWLKRDMTCCKVPSMGLE